MPTFARTGFSKVLPGRRRERPKGCPSGKRRYGSEADALDALVRVRKVRVETADPDPPEQAIYRCSECPGWHLTSKGLHPDDLDPERERRGQESWQSYARRLEKRVAAQRAQLLSLHTLGYGTTNKQNRKRTAALVAALGRMTERWERERAHRMELVVVLNGRCRCWWCRLRRGRSSA